MAVTKREFKVLSSDKKHKLAGVIYLPEGEAKGFFHIVHGMTEYMGRYERFMQDMAASGWICFGYDHLGHGHTAIDDRELGYIAKKDGWKILVKDVEVFAEAVFAEYGGRRAGMPYCLMGHSMGSFIVRLAAEMYVKPDRLIIMGTGGSNPLSPAGIALAETVKLFKGDKHISKLVGDLAFKDYNSKFADELKNAPAPWITTNFDVRKKYAADKFCTFKFTVSAMCDLFRLLQYSNRGAWYKKLSADIPVLLVSGEDDPVGNYGKGVFEVYQKLKANSARARVDCILYEGARHEILNDFTYGTVKKDIIEFCK